MMLIGDTARMSEKHKSKFFLASICAFNFGAMTLVILGLDWLSWLMFAAALTLWFMGMKTITLVFTCELLCI